MVIEGGLMWFGRWWVGVVGIEVVRGALLETIDEGFVDVADGVAFLVFGADTAGGLEVLLTSAGRECV